MKSGFKIVNVLVFVLGCFLLSASAVNGQTKTGELFEKALYMEEVKGELQQAVNLYMEILEQNPSDRQVAAKSLLHMGICYEKLGQEQAYSAYKDLIARYPEQKDEVLLAKKRLVSLEKTLANLNRKPKFRRIEIASKPKNGVLSPDGKKLAFMSGGAVWTVPLQGKVAPNIAGEPKKLADIPDLLEKSRMICWSANGNWIAVYGDAEKESDVVKGTMIYTIPVNGGKLKRVNLPAQGGYLWNYKFDISPNGEMLAFTAIEIGKSPEKVRDAHERYIYTKPVTGGNPKQVSSGWAKFPSFSSDGKFIAYIGYRERKDKKKSHDNVTLWISAVNENKSIKLAHADGGLMGPVWSPDDKFIAANLDDQILVYPVSFVESNDEDPIKIDLPGHSYNTLAGWTPENELGVFIMSEFRRVLYTVPVINGKATQVTLEGQAPYYPCWLPNGDRIYFRRVDTKNETVMISSIPAQGGESKDLYVNSNRKLISIVPGGGLNISPDGKNIVISAYQLPYEPKEGADIWIIQLETGTPFRLTNNDTFERHPCWSPDGKLIAFIDQQKDSEHESISIVSSEGGTPEILISKKDVIKGTISFTPDGKKIAFFSDDRKIKTVTTDGNNKVTTLVDNIDFADRSELVFSPDGSKIAYNLKGKIWIVSLDSGKKEQLKTGLPEKVNVSGGFDWSPDGEKIVFCGQSGGKPEFWLISDFLPTNMK